MFRFLNRLIARHVHNENRAAYLRGERVTVLAAHPSCGCNQAEDGAQHFACVNIATGELSEPKPHPHPLFSDKLKVSTQSFMQLQRCKFCGATYVAPGLNYVEFSEKPKPQDA
jgi:hypothetical protein